MAKPTHGRPGASSPGQFDGASIGSWIERSADSLAAGTVLGGKYRLLSEIGSGGMGSVWRAEHLGWEAPVALKVMKRDIMAHPEALARFEREVRLAAGLRSPHVVQVLDHGVDAATGVPFISMELLEGEPLARRIRRLRRLGPGETFQILSQLVRALSRAHEAGIVHRDLKPDNVFLVENDGAMLAKVLDFGVAKWTQPDLVESGLTRPGSVVGTPYYMSPEQIQGSRDTDHRADLWALAIIACECLTGRRPFEAPDFARLAVLLLGEQPRPVPSSLGPVPPGFDAWFAKATDPDPSRRFQTARELSLALAPICGEAPSSGRESLGSAALGSTRAELESVRPLARSESGIRLPASRGQRPMAKLVLATAASTLLVIGSFAFWLMQRSSARLPPAPPAAAPRVVEAPPRPPSAPPSTGPVVRPLHDAPPAREAPAAAQNSAAQSAAAEEDPEARRRRVRAALLDRPRVQRQARPAKPRSSAPRARPAPPRAAPPKPAEAAPPRPAEAAPRPSPPAPPLVDGRRIRTTL